MSKQNIREVFATTSDAGDNSTIRLDIMKNLDYTIQPGKFDRNNKCQSKGTMTGSTSCIKNLLSHDYTKKIHINGNNAAIFFYAQIGKEHLPFIGSRYFILDKNCPNIITRNIQFHKHWGKVSVLSINDDFVNISTREGKKTIVKSVFIKHACNSLKECWTKDEKANHAFNSRIENTEVISNHCSRL